MCVVADFDEKQQIWDLECRVEGALIRCAITVKFGGGAGWWNTGLTLRFI